MASDHPEVRASTFHILRGGGELGSLMRAHDWANSGLGSVADWPQPLKTLVGVILAASQPMFIAWGPERLMLYNDAYAALMGDRHPSALGRPFFDVWHDIVDECIPLFEQVFAGEPVNMDDIELRPERPGRPLEAHFAFSYTPVRDEADAVAGLFCVCSEITEQVFAERRMHELTETLEQRVTERTQERDRLWNSTQDLQIVIDGQGWIEAVNPAFTTILGWTVDEVVGRNVFDFIIPDEEATLGALQHARKDYLPVFENRYRHKDGGVRWFSWVASPEAGMIYASGRHITAEKEQAEALIQSEEQLRQAQKMEAVGQLTGGLAHDFNNLLTGMMGNLELLQLRVARGRLDDLDRLINAAQGAGRRAAALTQRLLAFSRRQTLDPKPTDVNRLIAGLEDMLRRTVGATTEIEVVGAAGLWTASIDAGQLENALLNLCINGRDAMPDGGKLTIETANKWIDDRVGHERDLEPGQYISLCVTDTGMGMSAETIRRAFEPFFTTKPIGQGTGLGLSMIYGFARQSGGQVRIYSELGQGTTVCIYLPRHHGDAEATLEHSDAGTSENGKGQTILVVDDEATIRHLIDEVLDEVGYTVIGAADGAAGLKVLQSGAKIELLITDVGLPNGMNGRQVADAARSLRPGLKVLFITGFAENAAVGNGHLEPGMELLTKPFSLDALTAKVADMLKANGTQAVVRMT